ncbi:hypothetical protein [Cryobacterium sp. PH29-G1]|uniref:hypothetical protein n=1 Tax=Cryobacterium sp. PH29-G1 TaxID=3046211 RepID=UPI0024B89F60|nr:hypothetical protein [Cryobacterium sp. PH29-G1]MDJ0348426.1 hypothetical protein [Cryobacterium sp. PH29-G1]
MIRPRSDGQVRDIFEVMRGSATRIGEVLALRQCDVDLDADPPRVTISGTLVVQNKAGLHRQDYPKSHEPDRTVESESESESESVGSLGDVAQYETSFRLCYLRGPAGIIVALAEQIG